MAPDSRSSFRIAASLSESARRRIASSSPGWGGMRWRSAARPMSRPASEIRAARWARRVGSKPWRNNVVLSRPVPIMSY